VELCRINRRGLDYRDTEYTTTKIHLNLTVNKSQTKSFQYVVNCCFGKILNVRSKEDIEFCMQMFNCPSVDLTVAKRKVKFLTKYCHSENSLCSVFRNRARSELDKIGLNSTSY